MSGRKVENRFRRNWESSEVSMVVCEGVGFVVLFGQFAEVTMDVVWITALGFQLDCHVFDTEVSGDAVLDQLQ